MRRAVLVVLVLFCLPFAAAADDASRRQLAEQFLTVNKVKEQVELMYQKVEEIIVSQLEAADIPAEREKNIKAMQKISRDILYAGLSWESLKEEYVGLYAETFTEEELEGIIEFSKSPLGIKMAEKSPILMHRSMEIGRQHAQQVMPEVQKAIQDYMKENFPATEEEKAEKAQ